MRGAPTVRAFLVAKTRGRRHLDALVALDSVKFLLVAGLLVAERLFGVMTGLDRGVAEQVIPLFLEELNGSLRNEFVYGVHEIRFMGKSLKNRS